MFESIPPDNEIEVGTSDIDCLFIILDIFSLINSSEILFLKLKFKNFFFMIFLLLYIKSSPGRILKIPL